MTTEERKKVVSQAVKKYRENQLKHGRKQTPVMLTAEDKDNMADIKENEPDVNNQGEAISKALTHYVKKYEDKK